MTSTSARSTPIPATVPPRRAGDRRWGMMAPDRRRRRAGGSMSVEGLDHVAITVADVDVTLDWYERVLGAEAIHRDLWADGTIPIALLQVGGSRLSVHPAAAPAAPHADAPTAGSADLCFRWSGPIATAVDALGAAGVE